MYRKIYKLDQIETLLLRPTDKEKKTLRLLFFLSIIKLNKES